LLKVIRGDITKLKCDAIVNPANSFGYMGGGVAGAIKRAGGIEIEKEAVNKAPIPVGSAVATTSGTLPCKYVIHAPTMERPAMRTNEEKIRKATRAALLTAKNLGLRRIAIPGMGTGVGGVNANDAARDIIEVAKEFAKVFDEIIFVDISDEMVNAWKKELSK